MYCFFRMRCRFVKAAVASLALAACALSRPCAAQTAPSSRGNSWPSRSPGRVNANPRRPWWGATGATMWAALDCPSGLAWINGRQPSGPAVLGRMSVALHRRPRPGEHLVVAGWPISAEGRKLLAGAAVWSADGEVLAVNAATWIRLSDDQQAAFRVAGSS